LSLGCTGVPNFLFEVICWVLKGVWVLRVNILDVYIFGSLGSDGL
jgi:hypothetical protein